MLCCNLLNKPLRCALVHRGEKVLGFLIYLILVLFSMTKAKAVRDVASNQRDLPLLFITFTFTFKVRTVTRRYRTFRDSYCT